MPRLLTATAALILSALMVSPALAQTLSSRPAIFADPVLMIDPSYGELVLGRTTLAAALRIFAADLADSVKVPLGHPSNPDTVWTASGLSALPGPKPYHRLELGPERYTLYFDRNQRLVAARTDRSRLPRSLRRKDLVARYASLRVQQRGRTAEGRPVLDWLVAPLGPCVAFEASVWEGDDGLRDSRHLAPGSVIELGYTFTCSTTPAHPRAVLDREP